MAYRRPWRETTHKEEWICYRSKLACAKRLTAYLGQEVLVKDAAAYSMIMLQGHGTFGGHIIKTPALIRYGQLTHDEYFVGAKAAKDGVLIKDFSESDSIVMLKHVAENPDLEKQNF